MKLAALELGLPVTMAVPDVVEVGADLGVVVAFGRLVRPDVLARLAMVNLHFSLLPRWRGAAPVERAILAGDRTTGVSLMALEEGLDTGGVYARAVVAIDPFESAAQLRDRLGALGTDLLLERLAGGRAGLGTPEPQVGEPSYAAKVTPDELRIDWAASAEACHRVVRIGRAWTTFRGRRLVMRGARPRTSAGHGPAAALPPGSLVGNTVVTGDGVLELLEVQGEGRRSQPFAVWAAGARPTPGEMLGG